MRGKDFGEGGGIEVESTFAYVLLPNVMEGKGISGLKTPCKTLLPDLVPLPVRLEGNGRYNKRAIVFFSEVSLPSILFINEPKASTKCKLARKLEQVGMNEG